MEEPRAHYRTDFVYSASDDRVGRCEISYWETGAGNVIKLTESQGDSKGAMATNIEAVVSQAVVHLRELGFEVNLDSLNIINCILPPSFSLGTKEMCTMVTMQPVKHPRPWIFNHKVQILLEAPSWLRVRPSEVGKLIAGMTGLCAA